MAAVAVIPARLHSSRLPGKLLLAATGKPVLQHTYERCKQARALAEVWVATDHDEIRRAAESFGAKVMMTSSAHPTGSDRVAEVAAKLEDDVVLNVQGDEPMIDPADLDRLVQALAADEKAGLATLAIPLHDRAAYLDPNVVKVVVDHRGRALYFSRAPIPAAGEGAVPAVALKHKGVYAYRRAVLLDLASRKPVALEVTERLEQLRALHHGIPIRIVQTSSDGVEVNTPEDYRRFVEGTRS